MIHWEDVDMIVSEIKSNGYYVCKGSFSEGELETILNIKIPSFQSGYSEMMVNKRLYRKREKTEGRVGDALIVSMNEGEFAPFLIIDGIIANFYLDYIKILGQFLGKTLTKDTKVLLNYQFYKEGYSNSLPFHFDAEIFEGSWGKERIEIKEGLIPRIVMVVVLENENFGEGLQLMSNSGEIIKLKLTPGDILYFDNTSVLHGVPEDLPKKRTIIGFRSFETEPLYFKEEGFVDNSSVISIDNPFIKGEAKYLTSEEAKDLLVEKGWYYR